MRVPTVKLKHRDGRIIVVNETDYALGSLPGISIGGDWTRISERSGEGDAAVAAAKDQRETVEKQLKLAEDVEKRAKIANKRKNAPTKAPIRE